MVGGKATPPPNPRSVHDVLRARTSANRAERGARHAYEHSPRRDGTQTRARSSSRGRLLQLAHDAFGGAPRSELWRGRTQARAHGGRGVADTSVERLGRPEA